jgi:hypothetical protein
MVASGQMIAKPISVKLTGGKFRRLRGEGGRTYLGRSVACHGFVTKGEAIHLDRVAEVSKAHSRSCRRQGS